MEREVIEGAYRTCATYAYGPVIFAFNLRNKPCAISIRRKLDMRWSPAWPRSRSIIDGNHQGNRNIKADDHELSILEMVRV